MLGLLGGVRRVEGLDPVEADVADQALDQVAHLLGVLDVPVGVGDDGDAAGVVDDLDRLLGGRPLARDERLRARDQVLLEERAEVGPGAGRLGDVGAADRVGGAGLGDRVLEGHLDPVAVEVGDDLLGAVDALLLGLRAGRRDLLEVDPVAADVQVLGVLVDARHLGRRARSRSRARSATAGRLLDAGDAVVVGQRHHRDPGLGRRAGDVAGLELAVGDGGMALQVDHRRARLAAARTFLTQVATIGRCGSQPKPTTRSAPRSSSPPTTTASRSRASGSPRRRASRCSSSSTSCSSSSTRA